MTIYLINGKKEVVETINVANPANAAAIATQRITELKDDQAYWTDRLPKSSRFSTVERATYQDEHGDLIYQIASRSHEVRCEGWLI